MPLVRRRRPLLRAVAIASGAYAVGKRRRQDLQERFLDQSGTGPQAQSAVAVGGVKADVVGRPARLQELRERDALNGASTTERNRK